MEAGRELDALVAEKVMGIRFWLERRGQYTLAVWTKGAEPWKQFRASAVEAARYRETDHVTAAVTGFFGDGPPKYSRDIAAAWEVVQKLEERVVICDVERCSGVGMGHPDEIGTNVDFRECAEPYGRWAVFVPGDARTATPLAICLAALRACGAATPTHGSAPTQSPTGREQP